MSWLSARLSIVSCYLQSCNEDSSKILEGGPLILDPWLDRSICYKKLLFLKNVNGQEILMHKSSFISFLCSKLAPIVGTLMLMVQNWEMFPWFLRPAKVGSGACACALTCLWFCSYFWGKWQANFHGVV